LCCTQVSNLCQQRFDFLKLDICLWVPHWRRLYDSCQPLYVSEKFIPLLLLLCCQSFAFLLLSQLTPLLKLLKL
jgi:hypothetical protein